MPPKINTISVRRKLASLQKRLDPAAFEQMIAEIQEILSRSEENIKKFMVMEEKRVDKMWAAQTSASHSLTKMTLRELVDSGSSFTINANCNTLTITNITNLTGCQATPSKQDSKLLARKQAILMSQKRSIRQSKRRRDMAAATPSLPVVKKIDNTLSVDKVNKFRISMVNPKTPKGGRILPKEPRVAGQNEAIVTLKCSVSGTPLLTRDLVESEHQSPGF